MLKKTDADKYEIKSDLFKLTKILGYGDCLYYSVSMYFYNHQNNHLKIRNEIYNYLRDKKDRYFEYFVNENFLESVKEQKIILWKIIEKENIEEIQNLHSELIYIT